MAAAVRGLKRWVLTPMADTRDQFVSQVRAWFVLVASGEWDQLPLGEPEHPTLPERLHRRLLSWGGAVLMAGFPLGLLFLLRAVHMEPEPTSFEYFKIAAIIWAVISLLVGFDSQLGAKLAAMKDYAQLLPFGGKGKKD